MGYSPVGWVIPRWVFLAGWEKARLNGRFPGWGCESEAFPGRVGDSLVVEWEIPRFFMPGMGYSPVRVLRGVLDMFKYVYVCMCMFMYVCMCLRITYLHVMMRKSLTGE